MKTGGVGEKKKVLKTLPSLEQLHYERLKELTKECKDAKGAKEIKDQLVRKYHDNMDKMLERRHYKLATPCRREVDCTMGPALWDN